MLMNSGFSLKQVSCTSEQHDHNNSTCIKYFEHIKKNFVDCYDTGHSTCSKMHYNCTLTTHDTCESAYYDHTDLLNHAIRSLMKFSNCPIPDLSCYLSKMRYLHPTTIKTFIINYNLIEKYLLMFPHLFIQDYITPEIIPNLPKNMADNVMLLNNSKFGYNIHLNISDPDNRTRQDNWIKLLNFCFSQKYNITSDTFESLFENDGEIYYDLNLKLFALLRNYDYSISTSNLEFLFKHKISVPYPALYSFDLCGIEDTYKKCVQNGFISDMYSIGEYINRDTLIGAITNHYNIRSFKVILQYVKADVEIIDIAKRNSLHSDIIKLISNSV